MTTPHHRGFTFTEVLFAMMILGIGFIMVAAMFPVAIRETQETVQETTGTSVAKSGASYIGRLGNWDHTPSPTPAAALPLPYNTTFFPGTGGVVVNDNIAATYPVTPPSIALNTGSFWSALSGNLICPTDTRYAFVPFYSRGNVGPGKWSSYAQITVIAVQCRNQPNFKYADTQSLGGYPPNLKGRPLLATFTPGGNGPDIIQFFANNRLPTDQPPYPASYAPSLTGAIAPGCFVILADDSGAAYHQGLNPPSCNGYVYKVGNFAPGYGVGYELMPGNDMKGARFSPCNNLAGFQTPNVASPAMRVFVVGMGYTEPAKGNMAFGGPVMDIEAFSTFIKVQ